MPDPPPLKNQEQSIKTLKLIGCIDSKSEFITPLGKILLQLPADVRVGKTLLMGIFFKCIDPILTISAIFTLGKTPFLFSMDGNDIEGKRANQAFYECI